MLSLMSKWGLLIVIAYRYLLEFGTVGYYLGYNALQDFFPSDSMRPNPECSNSWCVKRQEEYKVRFRCLVLLCVTN